MGDRDIRDLNRQRSEDKVDNLLLYPFRPGTPTVDKCVSGLECQCIRRAGVSITYRPAPSP